MAIKPHVKVVEKRKLTHRDGFLVIVALIGGSLLAWFGRGEGDMAFALTSLSYVMFGISAVMLVSMFIQGSKKKHRT